MTDKYAELRRLAEAATPGDWICGDMRTLEEPEQQISILAHEGVICRIRNYVSGRNLDAADLANGEFIAAANPSTILALIDKLEAAQKDAGRYRFLMDQLGGSVSQVVMGSPVFSNEDVDSAIDAAMQEQKP